MIIPLLKNDALLESIKNSDHASDNFDMWWLGQSGFLIQWHGQHLLLDPYLSDSLTKKYASTDKPHIRMTELAIDPARLDFIDVVTSSHNHTDHLDAETLKPILAANPAIKFIIPEANRAFVADRIGCQLEDPIGLNENEKISVGHFTIHGLPAAHNTIEKDEQGRCLFMGYVIEFGPWTVYHSGDTLWYQSLSNLLRNFDIDVALLPINGNKPERKVAGNLDPEEAARLGHKIGARLVIPCHYDMFTFNTANSIDLVLSAADLRQPHQVLQCGEPWNSEQLGREVHHLPSGFSA